MNKKNIIISIVTGITLILLVILVITSITNKDDKYNSEVEEIKDTLISDGMVSTSEFDNSIDDVRKAINILYKNGYDISSIRKGYFWIIVKHHELFDDDDFYNNFDKYVSDIFIDKDKDKFVQQCYYLVYGWGSEK